MKILILGAGKMGSFFTDLLSFDHEVAVLEKDPKRMRFIYNALRLQHPEEVADFAPELVINCVTLSYTIEAFKSVMPYLQPYCIISDIASVKTHLKEFYEVCGFPYVSTHPMFGPTFANLGQLEKEPFGQDLFQGHLFQLATAYLRVHVRGARQGGRLLFGDPVRVDHGLRRHDETPGRARYHLQAPHEDCPWPVVGR